MKTTISKLLLGTALGLAAISAATAQDKTVKIGSLSDQSGLYADLGGPGSTLAAQMAAEDSGLMKKGWKIDIISGDHQNKPDIGSNIARQWFDVDKVDVVVDVGSTPPVHTVPFSVNVVGTPTWSPVTEPLKPNDAVPPVGIDRFQSTLDAVTLAPEAANVAFQPWPKRSEPGNDQARVHPSTGSPRLWIVTFAENPPCHLFCTT